MSGVQLSIKGATSTPAVAFSSRLSGGSRLAWQHAEEQAREHSLVRHLPATRAAANPAILAALVVIAGWLAWLDGWARASATAAGHRDREADHQRGPAQVAPASAGGTTSSPASGRLRRNACPVRGRLYSAHCRHLAGRRLASGDFRLRDTAIRTSLARRGHYRLAVIAITRIPGSVRPVSFTLQGVDPARRPWAVQPGLARTGERRARGPTGARTFATAGPRRPGRRRCTATQPHRFGSRSPGT